LLLDTSQLSPEQAIADALRLVAKHLSQPDA